MIKHESKARTAAASGSRTAHENLNRARTAAASGSRTAHEKGISMNQKILHTPDGVRDIYGDECERKQILEGRLHQVLSSFGYRDIETPTFEFFDVFGRDVGTIPSRDLYKFFDREGDTLVLRPDFTPSIARAASRYFQNFSRPIRLDYVGNTFINHSSLQGRLKESTQMGAELIGESSADGDAEVIAMAAQALTASGLKDFQISVGHVGFFESLVSEAGIDEETEGRLRELIRNRNTFGVQKLISEQKIDEKIGKLLGALPTLAGPDSLERAWDMSEGLKARSALERLKEVQNLLKVYGVADAISFDLAMISAYMYYTGIIFRGYTYGTGEAVVKGGRYDSLLGHFGKDAPSVGFVIVVNQLMNALLRQKIEVLPEHERYLILYREGFGDKALARAVAYRGQGKYTETCRVTEEMLGQMSFADFASGIRASGGYASVITVGEDE